MSVKPVLRLATVAALAISLPACRDAVDNETPRQALERLAPSRAGEDHSTTATPGSFRINYDRIDAASKHDKEGHFTPTRIEQTVRRPFGSGVKGELQRRLGFEQDSPTSVERAVLLRPAADDARPDAYPPAQARDANRDRDVAGRTCRVYLYDNDEYCLDGAGLVLASRVGTTVTVARKVTLLGDAATPAEIAASLAEGVADAHRGSVRPMEPTSSPPGRTDWSLAAAPEGFTFVGRFSVVPLTGEVLTEGSEALVAGVADVYVRGIDTVVIDRGGKLNLSQVTEKELGRLGDPTDADLGALGSGKVGIGGIGPFGYREVRALNEKGRYVVVAGTLPADELVEIARALHPSPGTTLRYLDKL